MSETVTVTIVRVDGTGDKKVVKFRNTANWPMFLVHKHIIKANTGFIVQKSVRGK